MNKHRIRLHGPWIIDKISDRIEISRKFHSPSQLNEGCRVYLGWILGQQALLRESLLNGVVRNPIVSKSDQGDLHLLEVTSLLSRYNEIRLVFGTCSEVADLGDRLRPHAESRWLCDAWLEIQEA